MSVKRVLTIVLVFLLGLGACAEGLTSQSVEGFVPEAPEDALWTDDMARADGAPARPGEAAVAAADGAAVDGTAFPDEKFRAIVMDRYDRDGDGLLSAGELEAVKAMDVSDSGIYPLRGIEHFTRLRKLDCSMNWIVSLDVSANVDLKELNVTTNDLTWLDVSHNPKLQRLYCINNKLQTLDVSHNPKLVGLYCGYNPLSALDVSRNAGLKELYCNNSRLTALDVRKNRKLTELCLYDNRVTALNLKGNPHLRLLRCNGNSLKKIDISACAALKRIVGRLPLLADSGIVRWCEDADVAQVDIDPGTVLAAGSKKLYRGGKPTSVSFGKKSITLKRSALKGKRYWFALRLKPAGTVAACTFTSSRKAVLSVRADGLVEAMKPGTTTLTVKTADGLKKSVKVIVK